MPKTFVSTATIVKRPMPVGKSFFAVSSVLPALPATRPALTLKRNVAAGSIKLLMSAMAVINRFPIAPLLTNTLTMPGFADRKYRECLKESRSGISMTRQELHQKDRIISPLIGQGQSPYQIITNHPELKLSVRSVYTYLDMGILTARNIDLKRKVKFKPRKVHKTQISDRRVFQNRTYADFQQLELSSFVEMDTVHSASGSSKTLLTFFFTREKLFLAFLMNRNTEGAVRLIFDRLEKRFGTYDFQTLFEYILTDRGSEFGDPESLETGFTGIQRTSIYYCDPMRSGQKGGLEQAHTMLRMILPKKTNFEFLTQWDVNLIVSHINSTPRESLQGRTPYDVALETLGEETLKAFQLRRIAPDEVNLTPKLIRFTR